MQRSCMAQSNYGLLDGVVERPFASNGVAKAAVLDALRRRSARTRACYSLPVSIFMFICFCICFIWHTDSTTAFTFESAIINEIVYGSGYYDNVNSRDSWGPWVSTQLLPLLVTGDGSPPSEATQVVGGYALPLGGIRLLQRRSSTSTCTDAVSSKLYAGGCYDATGAGAAGDIGNATDAASSGTPASAFQPTSLPGDSSGPLYQLFLSTLGPAGDAALVVDGLAAGAWTGAATQQLTVQVALLNAQPDVNRWALLNFDVVLTRGGAVKLSHRVVSFPALSYGRGLGSPVPDFILFLDLAVCAYTLYLTIGTGRRVVSRLRAVGCGAGISSILGDVWRMIDFGSTLSLISVIGTWGTFLAQLEKLRAGVAGDALADPAVYSTGYDRPGFLVSIVALQESFAAARLAAACALIFLTIRQFKYLQYQPRLAVFSQSLSMSLYDGAAFSVLFTILLTCYGVWGLAMFGSQAPDWSDPHVAIVSLFRYMMYDYDLPAMEAVDVDMARLFFASYMLLVTNMTLWMFLAIFLESYTVVRQASHVGSGIIEDAMDASSALGQRMSVWPLWGKGGCCGRSKDSSGVASCDAMVDTLETGALRDAERVTLAQLQGAARSTAASGSVSLTAAQVQVVYEEARTLEAAEAEGLALPGLHALSSEEEDDAGAHAKSKSSSSLDSSSERERDPLRRGGSRTGGLAVRAAALGLVPLSRSKSTADASSNGYGSLPAA